MTWYQLTHGSTGLAIGYGAVGLPLLGTLLVRRAALRHWLLAPALAALALIVAAVLWALITAFWSSRGIALPPRVQVLTAGGFFMLIGLVTGLLTAQRGATEAVKRGTVIEDGASRRKSRQIRNHDNPPTLTLAGIALSPEDETKHTKIIGTTGTGKSTAIREIVSGVLARGDRLVIADPDGGYLARYYNQERGDIVLNPFDKRAHTWG